jgi:hypothetical protein
MSTDFNFNLYFGVVSPDIFERSLIMIQPNKDVLYEELKRDVLELCQKIDILDTTKIPELFKKYLVENLTITVFNKNKHSPLWYLERCKF